MPGKATEEPAGWGQADGGDDAREIARRRRRRLAGAAAVGLTAAAAFAVVVLASGSSPRRTPGSGVPAGERTALVTRRTLSESATVDGTLGYGGERVLYDRLAGTFTWLPAVGDRVSRGGALYRIDNLPVVLMYGAVPAYRALKLGVAEGPDVAELNENLVELGYDPDRAIIDDDSYSEATAAAVRRWQHADGLAETGRVELGRIIFAPGPQRVTALKVSLGQDPPPVTEPASEAGANRKSKEPGANKAKKPKNKRKPKKSPEAESGKGSSPPKSNKTPKAEDPGSGSEDQAAGAGEPALSTTSTGQIVELKVKPEQQRLAHLGEHVRVLLPGEATAPGRITGVGTVASASSETPSEEKGGAGSEPTIMVTIALERSFRHLDEAPVSVELVKSIRRNVLTVPATALIATAGGGYAVEALHDGRTVPVAVSTGMFSRGYVQVEGSGIREGMTVTESE